MLLSTAYFPPLSWFALAARSGSVSLEACERYQKQSYRNRCYILASDGPQMLQVPVIHGADMSIRNVLVDYSTPWIVRTERALDTAYESSAYFEYLRDELFPILEARPEKLWDLNLNILNWCFKRLSLDCTIVPTSAFELPGNVEEDYRAAVHPKHPDTVMADLGLEQPYYQVFRDRMGGFTPGLSVLDLIFNEGPNSISFILK